MRKVKLGGVKLRSEKVALLRNLHFGMYLFLVLLFAFVFLFKDPLKKTKKPGTIVNIY